MENLKYYALCESYDGLPFEFYFYAFDEVEAKEICERLSIAFKNVTLMTYDIRLIKRYT